MSKIFSFLTFNEKNILEYVKNKGIQSSLEEISSLIKSQDRESIEKSQEKRFRYEIWDKKMAINGISAKDIIKSGEYTIDKAYLIYIDENIVYFQEGDVLEIDCENHRCYLNDEPCDDLVDIGSRYFELDTGENNIKTNSNDTDTTTSVIFRDKWLGEW